MLFKHTHIRIKMCLFLNINKYALQHSKILVKYIDTSTLFKYIKTIYDI